MENDLPGPPSPPTYENFHLFGDFIFEIFPNKLVVILILEYSEMGFTCFYMLHVLHV